ncbi:hypothetical protein [Archangium violaceum]
MGWLPRRLTAEQLEERRREAVRLLRGGHYSRLGWLAAWASARRR